MKIIGLTGGIGTGKSTVSKILRSFQVKVIDADEISRSLLLLGSPYVQELSAIFGSSILDDVGNLDRKRFAEQVFAFVETRKKLENFLHPLIRKEMETAIEAARVAGTKILVLDIPLLFEGNYWAKRVDEVWLVDANEEIQVRRVKERDQLSEDEIRARIKNQMPLAEKRRKADRTISNIGTIEELEERIRNLLDEQKL
jgi:dephospho-CoA kinase